MTVDVEDYFHVAALSSVIKSSDWSSMEYRAEASTRALLELFASANVKATFFILGWVTRRSPGLIREIHAAGHEVACHGMSHKMIYEQTPDEFLRETRDSKALLEDAIGAPVAGYRAASWSITRKSIWALDIIHDLGFEYDSSVFPIRHDLYGIPGAPISPGMITTPRGAQLLEFPPSTVNFLGARLPVAGGGYFRLLPYWLTNRALGHINGTERQPFMFYLHPWEVDPGQPRIAGLGWKSRFRHYTNLSKTRQRLLRLVGRFQFTSMRNVLQDAGLIGAPSELPLARAAVS
jgi:polysaccharide deacetylase family protein (PEP-CTERM system associated)